MEIDNSNSKYIIQRQERYIQPLAQAIIHQCGIKKRRSIERRKLVGTFQSFMLSALSKLE